MSDNKTSALIPVARVAMMTAIATLITKDPNLAAILSGLTESAALTTGQLHEWGDQAAGWVRGRGLKRCHETLGNVLDRAEDEGIEPDPEKLAELLETGLPFIVRASRDEKRRLMEEILMNGVRSLADQAKRIDAIEALHLIEAVPDGAALIFASFLRKLSGEDDVLKIKGSSRDSEVMPKCGLSDIVYQDNLFVIFNREGSKGVDIQGKTLIASQYRSDVGETHYFLSERGRFLARWITNNPAPRPEAEEAPPTE